VLSETQTNVVKYICTLVRQINSTKSPASCIRTLAIMGKRHKPGEYAKSCARWSVCFCSQSGGSDSIGLLT